MPTDNDSNREQDAVLSVQALHENDSHTPHIQLAQGAPSIGSVASLTGAATIVRATGETVQAEVGTPVFQDDTFETAAGGGVGLSFDDGSTFSLGPDARLTIDSYVYDAGGADSNMVMNLAQGAFSFVSGQVAKSGDNNMTIVTPTATIGIRGTAGAGDDDEIVLLQEPGQQLGELTVTTQGGTVSLTTPNSYTNTTNPLAPPTPPAPRSLGEIQSQFGGALRQLPVQLPANQNLPTGADGNNGGGGAGSGAEGNAGEGENTEGEDGEGEDGEGEDGEGEDGEGEDGEGEDGEGEDGEGEDGDGEDGEGEGGDGEDGDGEDGEGEGGEGEGGEGESTGEALPQTSGDDSLAAAPTPPPPIVPNVAPPGLAPPPPPPPPSPPPPPPPDPVIDDGGGDGGGSLGEENIIQVNSSSTVTLTAAPDRIEVIGGEVAVTIVGTLEGGDSIIDVTNTGAQAILINDVTSHSFTVDGIEDVQFGDMTGSELHSIAIAGTGTVIFNTNSGPLDANFTGDDTDNTFNIGSGISGISFISANMGGGFDTVNINTDVEVNLLLGEVELVSSALGGTQNVVMGNEAFGVSFDLGSGAFDELSLADGGNNITVANTETIAGGAGADILELLDSSAEDVNLGGGSDTITMNSDPLSGGFFNGGAGTDTLNLASGSSNTASVVNFEFINGVIGTSESLFLNSTVGNSPIIDLGDFDDADLLSLGNGGNDVTVLDLKNFQGGDGDDFVSLLTALDSTSDYDGGGSGNDIDTLILLDDTANSAVINDFEKIEGNSTTGIDLIFEAGSQVNTDITFTGTGADTITIDSIGSFANVDGVEFVFGGVGNDTIINIGASGTIFTLGDGGDVATGASVASDIFEYVAQTDADVGELEQITNFQAGTDEIDISTLIQGTFAYIGAAGFSESGNTEARFVDGTETLEIDLNGDAVADMEIIMNGITANDLTDSDFGQTIAQT
ncbi:hypothetical protein EOI86_09270 [Hwanghaeella grinnelliae]|uniref:FecR protein domain-containing protein n=1 Tax=Hwanghaeella grinnelliae TaxID=2500179 RepID=A0A437QXY5_9PROT|nr:FecR domain-containing protein [Hwanghaeella grinnelliae]RVU39407.1 hypothetical protein EOI86_09270 [Hwanghaeella grinnelliae]